MHRVNWRKATGQLLLLLLSSSSLFFPTVCADVSFEGDVPRNLEMGISYTIRWSTDADNVRITLISGSEASDNIYHLYDVICDVWIVNDLSNACTSTDDSVDWTPADDLPVGHYMLMANAADDSIAYSNQFNLAEAGSGSSSSSSGTASTTTAPASTTTASAFTSTITATSESSFQLATSSLTSAPGSSGSPTPDDGTSGGLSTGAKAGIGIGAAVGGLSLLGGLGFLIFRMGKKAADHKKENDEPAEGGTADGKAGSPPASADTAASQAGKAEGGDGGIAELQAANKIHEAPDYKTRLNTPREFVSELDATGGSFVFPQMTRPNTADGAAVPESADKDGAGDKAAPEGEEGQTAKEGEAGTSEGEDRAPTSSATPKSVVYETPDDVGRPAS